ncbi:MAG TPA: von Willebrand factor type A domain-containing protein [Candidatus Limnocylindrales bacterium]
MRRKTPIVIVALALALAGCSKASDRSDGGNDAPGLPGRPQATTDTSEDNASTFALDVDTASYTYAARRINDGSAPEARSIRPEEFINYFNYRYPQPGGNGFTVNVDGAHLPGVHKASPDMRLVRVGLQTRAEDEEQRRDASLTFVIDVSGSMAERGRLDLVQDALHYLVDQLRPADSVAIVAFNDKAQVLREMTRVGDKERLHSAVDQLESGGSTNLGDGIVTGYRVARDSFRPNANNRVILLSDGLANTGDTSASSLLEKIRAEADKEISLMGVGVGSDYGDKLMEKLADRGDGFVVYISEQRQAREVFVRKLPANLSVRAYDAKAQVIFNRSNVESYRLVGYDNRQLADDQFRDDTVDGGEVGPGHSVTALYVVHLRPSAEGEIAKVRVRWLDPQTREATEISRPVQATQLRDDFDDAGAGLKTCYTAAFFAESLRRNEAPPLPDLAVIIESVGDEVNDPKVDELTALINRAERMR